MYLLSDYHSAEFARKQGSKDTKIRKKRTLGGALKSGVKTGAVLGSSIGLVGGGVTGSGVLVGKRNIKTALIGAGIGATALGTIAAAQGGITNSVQYGVRRLLAKDKNKFDEGY